METYLKFDILNPLRSGKFALEVINLSHPVTFINVTATLLSIEQTIFYRVIITLSPFFNHLNN